MLYFLPLPSALYKHFRIVRMATRSIHGCSAHTYEYTPITESSVELRDWNFVCFLDATRKYFNNKIVKVSSYPFFVPFLKVPCTILERVKQLT